MIHVIGTLVVAPYAALALGFLAIGRLAGSSDLWDLFDRMVQAAAWFMPWGALGFVTLFIVVAGLGAVADTRAIGRRALFALSVAVLGILVLYRPSAITAWPHMVE